MPRNDMTPPPSSGHPHSAEQLRQRAGRVRALAGEFIGDTARQLEAFAAELEEQARGLEPDEDERAER